MTDIHTHLFPEQPGSALVCVGENLSASIQGHIVCAGLHPWNVTGKDDGFLSALDVFLTEGRAAAIGECGFDTLRGPSLELQELAFVRQVELSERYGLPMVLHVVRAFDRVIRLRRDLKPAQRWLIHGFRGGPEQMRQLLSKGLDLSFGPGANVESLRLIPSDCLFLETDGKADIHDVMANASTVRSVSYSQLERTITSNAEVFLKHSCTVQ